MPPEQALVVKSENPRAPDKAMALEVSPNMFRFAWFVMVGLHAACGAYLICVAMTYQYLTREMMMYYVAMWSETGNENYRFYGIIFGIIGGMHGLQVLHLVVISIWSKRLLFASDTTVLQSLVSRRMTGLSTRQASTKLTTSASQPNQQRTAASRSQISSLRSFFMRIWNTVFSRYGLLGVESEHFTMVFAAREVLEVSSQTYQAYRASNLLPRPGLNSFLIALLLTNCWSTAAIQYTLRKSPALERVASLGMDALISAGMMIVVPLIIFTPYVKEFDVPAETFRDPNYLYDPARMAILVLENRLIFVAGTIDLVTKVIPQLSILLSLVTISNLIVRNDSKVIPGASTLGSKPTMVRAKTVEGDDEGATGDVGAKPSAVDKEGGAQKPPRAAAATTSGQSSTGGRVLRVIYKWRHEIAIVLFCTWGIIIGTFHLVALNRAAGYSTLGCRASTRPWFSNGLEPCSSLVYDCNERGTTSPSETSFNELDPVALSTLAIVHCPDLRMPKMIQSFTSMLLFQIYNNTLVEWDVASSISATKHTRLLSVLVGRTNMTEFPPGMLEPLPASTLGILFSHTNLTAIPDDLYLRWHFLAALAFENGILTEVPYQTFFMPAYTLSLTANKLETIPSMAMMPSAMQYLSLRLEKNPLRELPAELRTPGAFIMDLNLQGTEIATLPVWAQTQALNVYLHGTPYCEAVSAGSPVAWNVQCTPRPAAEEFNFPTELMLQLYPFKG